MVSAPLLAAAVALAAAPPAARAFAPSTTRGDARAGVGAAAGPLSAVDDASARAMSEYMAKSHEEKLRAVRAVEDAKNGEIAALKAEIQRLKTSPAPAIVAPPAPAPVPAPVAPSSGLATSELESKIASYQSFMTEYIVNAQNQKLLAVKEAEMRAEKKFQERLEKLFEAGAALPSTGAAAEAAPAVAEETMFQKRNREIVAAAAAGKQSRWGDKEIKRAREQVESQPTGAATAAVAASPFELRNAAVSAAGAAGKSRWGAMEVAKANGAVEEKKPMTLEDRVNLGARLLS